MDPRETRQNIIGALIKHYGENWKTPLSKDLEVNISTIKRIFNQREEIPLVYQYAIRWVTTTPHLMSTKRLNCS